jgi:hypothetical protein
MLTTFIQSYPKVRQLILAFKCLFGNVLTVVMPWLNKLQCFSNTYVRKILHKVRQEASQ